MKPANWSLQEVPKVRTEEKKKNRLKFSPLYYTHKSHRATKKKRKKKTKQKHKKLKETSSFLRSWYVTCRCCWCSYVVFVLCVVVLWYSWWGKRGNAARRTRRIWKYATWFLPSARYRVPTFNLNTRRNFIPCSWKTKKHRTHDVTVTPQKMNKRRKEKKKEITKCARQKPHTKNASDFGMHAVEIFTCAIRNYRIELANQNITCPENPQ